MLGGDRPRRPSDLATRKLRATAAVIDFGVLFLYTILATILMLSAAVALGATKLSVSYSPYAWLGGYTIYLAVVYLRRGGVSPGRKRTGVRVRRKNQSEAGLIRLVIRSLINAVIWVSASFWLDLLFCITPRRRCLHDRLTGTEVYQTEPEPWGTLSDIVGSVRDSAVISLRLARKRGGVPRR